MCIFNSLCRCRHCCDGCGRTKQHLHHIKPIQPIQPVKLLRARRGPLSPVKSVSPVKPVSPVKSVSPVSPVKSPPSATRARDRLRVSSRDVCTSVRGLSKGQSMCIHRQFRRYCHNEMISYHITSYHTIMKSYHCRCSHLISHILPFLILSYPFLSFLILLLPPFYRPSTTVFTCQRHQTRFQGWCFSTVIIDFAPIILFFVVAI